jgi:uncharacterized membrane protein (Fun14 family)
MRLVTLLVLAIIGLTALGVISFHWSQDTVSVEFNKDRAQEMTERAIDAGKTFSDKIREDASEEENNEKSENPRQ